MPAFDSRAAPEGILDAIVRTIRQRGPPATWLGDNTNVVVVIVEPRRSLGEAGWSKHDARAYLFPLLKAGERPVRIGKPEGILIVGAGGPGMSETWVLFPHLAWAITEPVVPDRASGRERGIPASSERPVGEVAP